MKELILLVTFALVFQLVKGGGGGAANPPDPVGTVTCNNDHTVNINIANVDDLAEWATIDWQLKGNANCSATFSGPTVTYTNLPLPDCAYSSEQLSDSIKYVLKIDVKKPDPGNPGQLRAYDHQYYVTCEYDNQNKSTASFVPIKNRADNDSSTAFFAFMLSVFFDSGFSQNVPNPVALNQMLYFKAEVVTQSGTPNLDLFPVSCYSSKSNDPSSVDGKVTLITDGCGNNTVSQDVTDTLSYSCTNNSKTETLTVKSFRYFGAAAGDFVYFHCDLRACLADLASSMCECPSTAVCDPAARKRRSVADLNEEQVHHVVAGPYFYEEEGEEAAEEEAGSDEQDEPNLTIIVAVSGVVAIAIVVSITVYLVTRSRNRRAKHAWRSRSECGHLTARLEGAV